MTDQTVIDLGVRTIWVAMQVAAPALLITLITGVIISIIQAATQINEQNLSFIPKVVMMTLAMTFCGPWIMQTMMDFTIELFKTLPNMAH